MFVTFGVLLFVVCFFFFFKQKTAYDMRISDWSSDVCSSDLVVCPCGIVFIWTAPWNGLPVRADAKECRCADRCHQHDTVLCPTQPGRMGDSPCDNFGIPAWNNAAHFSAPDLSVPQSTIVPRSKERLVGKNGVSTCKSRC